jgi:hypothetical protein
MTNCVQTFTNQFTNLLKNTKESDLFGIFSKEGILNKTTDEAKAKIAAAVFQKSLEDNKICLSYNFNILPDLLRRINNNFPETTR